MNCMNVRNWLFRKFDRELSDVEGKELDAHLEACVSCRREYRLLSLPHEFARATPPFEPSPFFYSRLKTNIESETQTIIGWQSIWAPARRMIPALVGITLALFSVFAYLELQGPEMDLYKAYEQAFVSENQPQKLLNSEQMPVTDESVLSAIFEQQSMYQQNRELK